MRIVFQKSLAIAFVVLLASTALLAKSRAGTGRERAEPIATSAEDLKSLYAKRKFVEVNQAMKQMDRGEALKGLPTILKALFERPECRDPAMETVKRFNMRIGPALALKAYKASRGPAKDRALLQLCEFSWNNAYIREVIVILRSKSSFRYDAAYNLALSGSRQAQSSLIKELKKASVPYFTCARIGIAKAKDARFGTECLALLNRRKGESKAMACEYAKLAHALANMK